MARWTRLALVALVALLLLGLAACGDDDTDDAAATPAATSTPTDSSEPDATAAPTDGPGGEATPAPDPTGAPTEAPDGQPTDEPGGEPTAAPDPTGEPGAPPTEAPGEPTQAPDPTEPPGDPGGQPTEAPGPTEDPAPTAPPGPTAVPLTLTASSVGEFTFGVATMAELQSGLEPLLGPPAESGPRGTPCPSGADGGMSWPGFSLTFAADILTGAFASTVDPVVLTTPEGIGIGSTMAEVRTAYPAQVDEFESSLGPEFFVAFGPPAGISGFTTGFAEADTVEAIGGGDICAFR